MLSLKRIILVALLLSLSGAGAPQADVSVKTIDKIGPWSLTIARDTIQGIAGCQLIVRTNDSSFVFMLQYKTRPGLWTMASSGRWNYRPRNASLYLAAGDMMDTIWDAEYTSGAIMHGTDEVESSLVVLRELASKGTDIDIYDYRKRRIWTIPGESFARALAAMENCAKRL